MKKTNWEEEFGILKCMRCLWFVWIQLIFAEIENWKHCSKIIFKCINSVVGPINSAWIVFFVPCTVNSCDVTIDALGKKKVWKRKRGFGNADPNPHLVSIWVLIKKENYFTIQLIFTSIYGLHYTFWLYSWLHCTMSTNFYLYLQYFQ